MYRGTTFASGKWSKEEDQVADQLLFDFIAGKCDDCLPDMTLECYLAWKLNCYASRITHKFAKSILKVLPITFERYGIPTTLCC